MLGLAGLKEGGNYMKKDVVYYGEWCARSGDDVMLSMIVGMIALGGAFLVGLMVGVNL